MDPITPVSATPKRRPPSLSPIEDESPMVQVESVALEKSVFDELFHQFDLMDRDNDQHISADDLARMWGEAAMRTRGAIGQADRDLIAHEVRRALKCLDLKQNGTITRSEFCHYMLLRQQVPWKILKLNKKVRQRLKYDEGALETLLERFRTADADGTGRITYAELCTFLGETSNEERTKEILAEMDLDGTGTVNYFEFCNYLLGVRKAEVTLWVYDISSGASRVLSPLLFGRRIQGIWHTSIEVFGKEWWFGGNVFRSQPGTTPFGRPLKKIPLGHTLHSQQDLYKYVQEKLSLEFTANTYDVIAHNCNHFTNAVSQYLLNTEIPEDIRDLPKKLLRSGLARLARPFLNKWLGNFNPGGPRTHGGEIMNNIAIDMCHLSERSITEGLMVHYTVNGFLADGSRIPPVVAQVTAVEGNTCTLRWFRDGQFVKVSDIPLNSDRIGHIQDDEHDDEHAYFAALTILDELSEEDKKDDDGAAAEITAKMKRQLAMLQTPKVGKGRRSTALIDPVDLTRVTEHAKETHEAIGFGLLSNVKVSLKSEEPRDSAASVEVREARQTMDTLCVCCRIM